MSGNAQWWLNRTGVFAPVSNGGGVPNYGLTFDVATAPWDSQAQFSALVSSQVVSKMLQGASTLIGNVTPNAPLQVDNTNEDKTWWDHAKGGAGWLGSQATGVVGGIDALADKVGADATLGGKYDKLQKQADDQGLKGWDRLKFIGGADLGNSAKNLSEDPLASKVFWALDKVSEGAATAFVSATEAQKHGGMFFESDNLGRAHDLVKKYDLNAGEGFAQMFYDDEIIDDEERFKQIRKHSTVFNTSALAFNVIGAWKFDPGVLAGKGSTVVRDLRRGKLADSGASAGIQRDILAQTNRADAELLARNAGGIANRVRANRALTLWDKAQNLRSAAQTMGYEDFKRLAPFTNSASGVVLSKLMKDVAHDDDAWNLVFRASIGDQSAIPELVASRADLADKIDALELGKLPTLENEFSAVSTRYEKRLAEQGGLPGDDLILTSVHDWFLDQDFQAARTALESTKQRLAAHKDHESWVLRSARGLDDSRQTDAIFNTLDTLNPVKASREALHDSFTTGIYSLGGRVSTFAKDEFSPVSRFITAPRKPMLKRVGVVNLHDVEEGAQGVGSYLDQIAYMAGRQDQGLRNHILERWAGSATDMERKAIVDELEGQGIDLVLRKHGIDDPDVLQVVRSTLQGKRADAWGQMSDQARYTALTDESGRRLDKRVFEYQDDQGAVTKVAMPMDPTELPNFRPLTNLTDLDHALALHKDLYQELNKAHALGVKTRRLTDDVYNHVGETLNAFWKPAALISLRWPARVVADESFRVMLMLGPMAHLKAGAEGAFNILHNTGFVKPYEWHKGRKIKTGSLSEESLRSQYDAFDPFDPRSVSNPTGAVPADALGLDEVDEMRHTRLLAQAAEARTWLRKGQGQIPSRVEFEGVPDVFDGGDFREELRDWLGGKGMGSSKGRGRVMGNAVKRAVAEAPTVNKDLFRGSRDRGLSVGDEFDYDVPASFSGNTDAAEVFSIDAGEGAIYRLVGSKKALDATEHTLRNEEEFLAGGKFRIVAKSTTKRERDGKEVPTYDIEQVVPFGVTRKAKRVLPAKPKWAQRFEDRVAVAETAPEGTPRGFFFDPITGRAKNKGFAVSVYPGRLRTFDKKPSAAELHWWTEKNADLLSMKSNQVAVWLDKDTGRWHLDVVRTHARREDAMVTAAKAEADEFYDIGDGFTRYRRDEDPSDHAGYVANGPAGTPEGNPPTAPVEAVESATSGKRKVGVGTRKWKSADGKTVEFEDVYGKSTDDMNVYYSVHSSKGMAQRLYGGYTKGLGVARARRSGNGARAVHFTDEPDNWRLAQSEYVNKHFRKSPIWLRMLDGQSDEQVLKYLSSPEGRVLRQRMGPRGMNPHRWVTDMRAIFDHTLPTPQARLAAKQGDIDPKAWDDLIPESLRNDVHGDTILMAAGTHPVQSFWKRRVEQMFNVLGSMPTDQLVRHPFARNLYNLRMKNYLASVPADEITPEVMNAAAASARAFATKQVRRVLYNIADENQAIHMMRFVAPFFQAQMEVLEKYAHLFMSQPESLVRTMQMFYLSQQGNPNKGLWYMVDADGNPTSRFSHNNKMVIQKTKFVESLMDKVPGLKHAGELAIPVASMDLIFQGDTPYLPGMGPLVTIPAAEFYFKDRPWKSEGEIYKWLYPFGTPKGSNMATRAMNGMMPAWGKRMWTALTNDFNDSAYANFANIRYQDLVFDWEKEHGKRLPTNMVGKFTKQAESETRAYWMLRAASSFVMPFPVEARSPHQFWIDQARKYRNKYGLEADRKFYDDFGADYFKFFTESTKSTNGLAPTSGAARGYVSNKALIDKAPDLAGILAGPGSGNGEFNYEVYLWQLRSRKGPLSNETMRELQTPAQRIAAGQENQGWIEYGKLASAVDAEMRARGLTSLNSTAASDLRVFKAQKVREIIERNPSWQTAYRSREDHLSNWLNQAQGVAFEKGLDGRTDIEGLRAYLLSREKVQGVLQYRLSQGGSSSLSASANADLAGAWNSYMTELTSKNLLFAEIYHRYLEGDDLTVVVND